MAVLQAIARRYAKGLALATPIADWERILSEVLDLVKVYGADDGVFKRLFDDPVFSPSDRKRVIDAIANRFDLSQLVQHFLLLLIRKDRMALLPAIERALREYIDERSGRVMARVMVAAPISDERIDEVKKALAGITRREVVMSTEIAPELLGGMRIEVMGKIFDSSIKARLDDIKRALFEEVASINA